MKKGLWMMLTLLLAFSLTACGGGNGNAGGTTAGNGGTDGEDYPKMTIKFSHVVAETAPKHVGALKFKEIVESTSGGNITVEIYPNSSLYGDADEQEALMANNVQIIAPDASKLVTLNQQFNIQSMPFLFKNDAALEGFWDGEKGKQVLTSLEGNGILGLNMWTGGAKHMTNNVAPITGPDGFNGLKIRTQSGQMQDEVWSTLQASSMQIAFGDVYTNLENGTVDAQENSFNTIESKKFDEVQKYLSVMGMMRLDYAVLTNAEWYNGLNEATRTLINSALDESTIVEREAAHELDKSSREIIENNGLVQINDLTDAEIASIMEVLQPVYDKYKTEIGTDIIEDAESYSK
jgi:C4-dicarboxylate-binding protein DctP